MPDNVQRATWAQTCLETFMRESGVDDIAHCVSDLIANLGHLCDREGLPFLKAVQVAVGHWRLEQSDPESIDILPAVTIRIDP